MLEILKKRTKMLAVKKIILSSQKRFVSDTKKKIFKTILLHKKIQNYQ